MVMLRLLKKKYKSISDMPMHNWLECNKGNLGALYLDPITVKPNKELFELWTKIYDEYIEKIGLTPDYVELLEAMKKYTDMVCNYIEKPNSLNGTKLAAAKDVVEMLSNPSGNGKFTEFVAAIEKYMGIAIDLHTITVERFYSYVKLMERENKPTNG